ncbi:MAG TPA: xanthine dehydrogenase family protein molybdopterin-binding subunit [Acidimicrobiales bacterium]|nr:xanthine dehydrogenase family protein molybdopterin-binding subunit [Acidimicrobiales bacterium]
MLRKEDPALLVGGREYVEDIQLPGMGCVTYVRSVMAHARIRSVDTSGAEAAPGVLAVVTAADLDLTPAIPMPNLMPPPHPEMLRPWLADGVTRFVGEPIAAIVTETRAQGMDAAELVTVDYDPLPAVVDPHDAVEDETLLFPDVGTNVVTAVGAPSDGFFDGCDVVVKVRNHLQRLAPSPIETRGSVATWEDDRLTFWTTTQTPHVVRDMLAMSLGLEKEAVHVITPAVGGGFGAKGEWYHDQLLPAWLSRRVGRPLKWVETRSESMTAMIHGRSQWQDIEIGGTRDGEVQAYRVGILQDVGAYPGLGAMLPVYNATLAGGAYRIPKVETYVQVAVTNATPVGAYRGAGRPEMTDAVERAMDAYAAEIGMDPAEVRRKNLVPADAFPFTAATGHVYDSGNYERALDLALTTVGYDDLRAEQARRREAGEQRLLGIGISSYVEAAGLPVPEFGAFELRPDGTAVVYTGTASHGQGHVTTWAMIVSEQTGIPVEDIEVIHGDTALVASGFGTFGSRSAQSGGVASHQVAVAAVAQARERAAKLLEADPADVVLDVERGHFHVAGSPAIARTWRDVAESGEPLRTEVMAPTAPTTPFGSHVAVVEVDVETGKVTLERFVAVDDAGRILNPLLAEGQIHGGVAQGVAQALYEEFSYDGDGNPLTSNFADYTIISACEVPRFEAQFTETPSPNNELGVKGIGESGTIGGTAAVHNAAVDALAHRGIRHLDMPVSPQRVWAALGGAGK